MAPASTERATAPRWIHRWIHRVICAFAGHPGAVAIIDRFWVGSVDPVGFYQEPSTRWYRTDPRCPACGVRWPLGRSGSSAERP